MKFFARLSFPFLTVVVSFIMAVSCRSVRNDAPLGDYSSLPLSDRLPLLIDRSGSWEQINIPVKVDFAYPAELSASGRAYMRRGQDIYVTLRKMSVEVATLYVNSDSLFLTDKIHKRYVAEPVSSFFGHTGLSVSDVQDILLGRVFPGGNVSLDSAAINRFTVNQTAGMWTLTPRDVIAATDRMFILSCADNTLRSLIIEGSGDKMVCTYSRPSLTPSGVFMGESHVMSQTGAVGIDISFRWNFSAAKWSVSSTVRWKRPAGYRLMSLEELFTPTDA